jgi:hypothetical protein
MTKYLKTFCFHLLHQVQSSHCWLHRAEFLRSLQLSRCPKNYPYAWNPRFITMFTGMYHWILSWARWIQHNLNSQQNHYVPMGLILEAIPHSTEHTHTDCISNHLNDNLWKLNLASNH